jgi:hypothetical protein
VLGTGALGAFSALAPATLDGARRWTIVERARLEDDEMTVYAPAG